MTTREALQALIIAVAVLTVCIGANYISYLNAKRRGKPWSLIRDREWSLIRDREPFSVLTYNRREFAWLLVVIALFFALTIAATQLSTT